MLMHSNHNRNNEHHLKDNRELKSKDELFENTSKNWC